ncbi:MAG: LLM class flavin-dependent oxidoreductase [Steroidobacteraceae bacterium]
MKPTIGAHFSLQHGEMKGLRDAWMEAEALGVARIFTADHFHAQNVDATAFEAGQAHVTVGSGGKIFEATTVEAAIAATTTRPEIGCTVHAIGFRNPNLLADIARTIDHISGGRFILGLGAGYLEAEYLDYGYDNYGTQASRLRELAQAIPIIKARFEKLNPKPLRKIPLLIGAMGEKIGLRIVAEHADMWPMFGPNDSIRHKIEVLRRICGEIGRDFNEIEVIGCHEPLLASDNDPDIFYREFGMKHIFVRIEGPTWDLGPLRELLQWRKGLG